jgi:8-oxo-dGTP diphosphatase
MDEGALMSVDATLCWITKDGKALLKLANSGISKGKWNAVGGKVEDGESPLECVKREALEESGLDIRDPKYRGRLSFFFIDERTKEKVNDWTVHVFSADDFSGQLKESDEGSLKWFPSDRIPYDDMWADDMHWLPLLLDGKNFEGSFVFDRDGKRILEKDLRIIH